MPAGFTQYQLRQGLPKLEEEGATRADLLAVNELLFQVTMALNPQKRPVALAPIRSRPERTYEPIRDQQAPEGRHVPVVLARIHATDSDAWVKLKSQLEEFGRGSGLFSEVGVRQLGRSKRGPFQLEMSIEGQIGKRNLVDIGYGVSQALPIVVDAATATRGRTILIQQPEVHLHPLAQAESTRMQVSLLRPTVTTLSTVFVWQFVRVN
jgi:hypothetical protein